MNIDTPTEHDTVQATEHDTVQDINAQFPKIDNLEYFPEKVLFQIFSKVNDNDLLHLSDTSCRFEKIARVVFKEKYADKYFVFDGDSKQEVYEDLFSRFGRYAVIKAVEVRRIEGISEHHWLTQLLRQHTNRLQKLTFIKCSFKKIHKFLSLHMYIEHLILRSVETNAEFILPNYRNLKKLELDVNGYIPDNLEQTIRNNPTLVSLILKQVSRKFTLHEMLKMIAKNSMNLQHLMELHLNFDVDDSQLSADDMDSIIDTLKNLQSLKLTIADSHLHLIQRLSVACKCLKYLSLKCNRSVDFSDAMFDALRRFTTIEQFELIQLNYNDRVETVVGHMPNLSRLDLWMEIPDSSTVILSLLRHCPSIETISLNTDFDIKPKNFVNARFWDEFNEVMQHPNGKVELKANEESIVYVTKKEIVWKNKVMHWFEYDWKFNTTNVTLLDLAKPSAASKGAEAEQRPSPFDHILGYLDLASLYSMSAASEQSKQLVNDYVKRHAQQNGPFIISDEFHHDAEGLDAFAEHVENLRVEIFDTDFFDQISDLDFFDHLNAIAKYYTKLNKLSVFSNSSSGLLLESRCIFPQVRHLILNIHSHLCLILKCYPKLETLNIKRKNFLSDCCLKPLANCGLKKLTFEYGDERELNNLLPKLKSVNKLQHSRKYHVPITVTTMNAVKRVQFSE